MIGNKKKKLMFSAPQKNEKWFVSIRFPTDIKLKLKSQAIKEYKGRGKQSSLINDALEYYLYTCENINWGNYAKDPMYAELIDDIHEGLNQKPLENPTQVFLKQSVKDSILELEKKIKLTNPLLNDVRAGLIRKAVSIRLSIGDKSFFDAIMSN